MRVLLGFVCIAVAACHGHGSGKRVHITYDVDLDKAVDDRASEVKRDLDAQFSDHKLDVRVKLDPIAPGAVAVVPTDPTRRSELAALIKTTYGATLAERDCAPTSEAGAVCFAIADSAAIKKAALAREVEVVRSRIAAFGVDDASVTTQQDQLVVELPDLPAAKLAAVQDVIARTAALAFRVVDNDSDYMKKLFDHVGSDKRGSASDPDAIAAEIQAEVEAWRPESGGTQHDYYLTAHDREATTPELVAQAHCPRAENCVVTGRMVLQHYLISLALSDPRFAVPADREVVYERVVPGSEQKDRRPYWRSYFVERAAAVTGASIADATVKTDPRPSVMLELDRAGAQRFGEVTTRIVGKKLATLLDGTVRSAPIVMTPIRGGRAEITVGDAHDAAALAVVLKAGALPAPLVEASLIAM